MPRVLSRAVDQLIACAVWLVKSITADWVSQPCRLCQSILEMQTSISNHGCKHTKLTKVAEPKKHEMYNLSLFLVCMQVTCWKLCLTQPHPKSFLCYLCYISASFVWIKVAESSSVHSRGMLLICIWIWCDSRFFSAWWPLKLLCSFVFCNMQERFMGKSRLWRLGNKLWATYHALDVVVLENVSVAYEIGIICECEYSSNWVTLVL